MQLVTCDLKKPGYIYVYLTYENQSNNYVYFDDLKVNYTKSPVVQSNSYYAFGMKTEESWTRYDTQPNQYLYNSGSELNDATGNYEMFFRGYDPALGRMTGVDVMADQFSGLTPYNYAFNDPVYWNDPSGAAPPDGYESVRGGGCGCWRDRGAQDYGGEARGMYGSSWYSGTYGSSSPGGSAFGMYATGTNWGAHDAFYEAASRAASTVTITDSKLISAFLGAMFGGSDRTLYGARINGGHQFIAIDGSGNFFVPYTNQQLGSEYFDSLTPGIAGSLLDAAATTGLVMLNGLQTALDLIGVVPGAGEVADAANAGIYALRGDYANAALSSAALIPIAGWAATGAKVGAKAVTGFAGHGVQRAIERGVKPQSILDAVENPLDAKGIKIDALGRPSQRIIGKEAEVVINPNTGKIISVNPTSSSKAAKLSN